MSEEEPPPTVGAAQAKLTLLTAALATAREELARAKERHDGEARKQARDTLGMIWSVDHGS